MTQPSTTPNSSPNPAPSSTPLPPLSILAGSARIQEFFYNLENRNLSAVEHETFRREVDAVLQQNMNLAQLIEERDGIIEEKDRLISEKDELHQVVRGELEVERGHVRGLSMRRIGSTVTTVFAAVMLLLTGGVGGAVFTRQKENIIPGAEANLSQNSPIPAGFTAENSPLFQVSRNPQNALSNHIATLPELGMERSLESSLEQITAENKEVSEMLEKALNGEPLSEIQIDQIRFVREQGIARIREKMEEAILKASEQINQTLLQKREDTEAQIRSERSQLEAGVTRQREDFKRRVEGLRTSTEQLIERARAARKNNR